MNNTSIFFRRNVSCLSITKTQPYSGNTCTHSIQNQFTFISQIPPRISRYHFGEYLFRTRNLKISTWKYPNPLRCHKRKLHIFNDKISLNVCTSALFNYQNTMKYTIPYPLRPLLLRCNISTKKNKKNYNYYLLSNFETS